MAPAAVAALADGLDGAPWPAGTCIVTTGTRVPQAVRQRAQRALGCALHVLYGTTEAGMLSIAGPADHEGHPDSVGRVLPGVEVLTTAEDGRPLPAGEEGLLRFRSPGMVRGYLDDPEADARSFDRGWFRPGDVGRLLPDGELLVAGRADDRMPLGVIKIFPAEIEAAAEGFPGLRDCAAFAVPSGTFGDIPVLAVVAGEGLDAAALLAHLRARLGLRAPRRVLPVATLPRNASGKVLRRGLVALLRTEEP
jgi:acyl-CoA synthetase (AMP-forming)/AMP-acid ligase II